LSQRAVQSIHGFSKSFSWDWKKNCFVLDLGFSGGDVTIRACVHDFWPTLPGREIFL